MTLKLGDGNLLDHRGVEAVKTAIKPHTLKEKKEGSEIRSRPPEASKSRLLGGVAPREERGEGEGKEGEVGGQCRRTGCSAVAQGSGSWCQGG